MPGPLTPGSPGGTQTRRRRVQRQHAPGDAFRRGLGRLGHEAAAASRCVSPPLRRTRAPLPPDGRWQWWPGPPAAPAGPSPLRAHAPTPPTALRRLQPTPLPLLLPPPLLLPARGVERPAAAAARPPPRPRGLPPAAGPLPAVTREKRSQHAPLHCRAGMRRGGGARGRRKARPSAAGAPACGD